MDKKVREQFDEEYEDKKSRVSKQRDSQDYDEDNCELVDPLITNKSINGTLKEISAPYEIPHYPIEQEEHRRVVQQHLTDMTLNVGKLILIH